MGVRRFDFNKLIRSNIPPRMIAEGVLINKKELSPEEFLEQLKVKLVEEAQEVLEATPKQKVIEELADVTEVIKAISEIMDITREEIEEERLNKREINGYFAKENYINFIEVDETNRAVIEYQENKDRPYKLEIS